MHKAGNQAVAVLVLRLFLLPFFLLLLLSFKRLLCFDALLLHHVVLADGPLARGLKLHILHFLGGERLLHNEVVGKEVEHLCHARWYVARRGPDMDPHLALHGYRLLVLLDALVSLRGKLRLHLLVVARRDVGRERQVYMLNAHVGNGHDGHERHRHACRHAFHDKRKAHGDGLGALNVEMRFGHGEAADVV